MVREKFLGKCLCTVEGKFLWLKFIKVYLSLFIKHIKVRPTAHMLDVLPDYIVGLNFRSHICVIVKQTKLSTLTWYKRTFLIR